MGSPDNEKHCYANEGPRHRVVIAEPFAVSRYDVTFAEWDVCVANGDCNPKVSDSSFGHGLQPVINVTWDDAQHFAAWLARMTGRPYRLMTEAQWEYAARAGTTTAYPFGDDPASLLAHAWYKANSDSKPHPVGKKAANPWNLYDMEGDVWQWVEDCYHVTYDGAPTDGSAWTTGECTSRVLRGGSWISEPHFLRSACREYRSPDVRSDNTRLPGCADAGALKHLSSARAAASPPGALVYGRTTFRGLQAGIWELEHLTLGVAKAALNE
jgi:formylglycine-generating enzyme required for sulfatase activity